MVFRMSVSWHPSALHSPSTNGLAMSAEVGFNLLDEPWIVVLEPDGRERQVSILGAFEQAQQLGTIAGEVPTQAFAITRLLLAFLHRARSEEHTSELQSRENLVCRLLLEKKKERNHR